MEPGAPPLPPPLTPGQKKPDWAALPAGILEQIARKLVGQTEMEFRASTMGTFIVYTALAMCAMPVGSTGSDGWMPRWEEICGAAPGEPLAPTRSRHADPSKLPAHGLLSFSLTCKSFRGAQQEVGFLRTRVRDIIAPGRIEMLRWALDVAACPTHWTPQDMLELDAAHPKLAGLSQAEREEYFNGFAAQMDIQSPCIVGWVANVGTPEMMQWVCEERGLVPEEASAFGAALGGNLATLKWLREHDFPWDAPQLAIWMERAAAVTGIADYTQILQYILRQSPIARQLHDHARSEQHKESSE